MNPEKRQSPSTPFSSLHEDDGLITPWREIKRGVQRLTGRIAPDEDEESAKPADQRSYQHTPHLQVDPLPIHAYEENPRPAPPRPFAPIDAAETFAAPPPAPSINRIYTDAGLRDDRAERISPDSDNTAAPNPSHDRLISTDVSSHPSPRPTAPFDFGGDERDEPSDAAARTIRSDERQVDFGHDPSIDLRSGFDGDLPSSFSSDPSPRPTAPFDFGGDERDEPSDGVAQRLQPDDGIEEYEQHPSINPRRRDDEWGVPPQSFASSFDPSDWSQEVRRDPEPASSDDPAPDDEASDAPAPWLHVDPLHAEPPASPRERGGLRNPKWRPEPTPDPTRDPSDDVRSSSRKDAFEPSGDGMTPPAAGPSADVDNDDVAEPNLDQPSNTEPEADTRPSTKPAPAVDDAGHIFSPLDLRDRVVIMLLFKQVVSVEQVQETWVAWRREQRAGSKEMLWRAVARRDDVDREAVYAEAAEVYAFETHQLNVDQALKVIDGLQSARKFTEADWQRMRDLGILPIKVQQVDGQPRYVFGAYDPSASQVQQFAKHLKIGIVELVYVPESTIKALVIDAFAPRNEYLERISDDNLAFDLGLSHDQEGLVDEDALDAEINRSTLINLFEATLVEAVRQGASDIHIFPNAQNRIEIHMRLNGELNCWHIEERVHPEAFLAVVKDNAINIDRFERDMGQDGFLQRYIDNTLIRFRVSVMPLMSANHELDRKSVV